MAVQTCSLFYISFIDDSGKTWFFLHDSNYGDYPLKCTEHLKDAMISGEAYIKGRVSRIKKYGIRPSRFDVFRVDPNSITIHEIKFSHGVED